MVIIKKYSIYKRIEFYNLIFRVNSFYNYRLLVNLSIILVDALK